MTADMKRDWDERARDNAKFYIASADPDAGEAFEASGQRDVDLFFAGLESLLHGEAVVLDIGCGIGRMDQFVAPRVHRLHGIDVSGEMVAQARERLARLPNVEFHEGDGWTLRAIGDETIDLVFSHIVFQHVPRRTASSYFCEAFRVLRPGGDFVFQMPETNPGAPPDPPDDETFEMRFYEESELREQLEALGFEWVDCARHAVESPLLDFNQMRIHAHRPAPNPDRYCARAKTGRE